MPEAQIKQCPLTYSCSCNPWIFYEISWFPSPLSNLCIPTVDYLTPSCSRRCTSRSPHPSFFLRPEDSCSHISPCSFWHQNCGGCFCCQSSRDGQEGAFGGGRGGVQGDSRWRQERGVQGGGRLRQDRGQQGCGGCCGGAGDCLPGADGPGTHVSWLLDQPSPSPIDRMLYGSCYWAAPARPCCPPWTRPP